MAELVAKPRSQSVRRAAYRTAPPKKHSELLGCNRFPLRICQRCRHPPEPEPRGRRARHSQGFFPPQARSKRWTQTRALAPSRTTTARETIMNVQMFKFSLSLMMIIIIMTGELELQVELEDPMIRMLALPTRKT